MGFKSFKKTGSRFKNIKNTGVVDIFERFKSPNGIQKIFQKYRHSIPKYQKYQKYRGSRDPSVMGIQSFQIYQKYRYF